MVPEKERMAPGAFIKDEKLTVWSSVPSVLAFMARTRQLTAAAFPHLRAAMFCGEPLPVSSVEALLSAAPSCRIDNQYGSHRSDGIVRGRVGVGRNADAGDPSRGIVSIGEAFPGTRLGIVDGEGRFLPRGEKGELRARGRSAGTRLRQRRSHRTPLSDLGSPGARGRALVPHPATSRSKTKTVTFTTSGGSTIR